MAKYISDLFGDIQITTEELLPTAGPAVEDSSNRIRDQGEERAESRSVQVRPAENINNAHWVLNILALFGNNVSETASTRKAK